jgi:hypothetical protein
MSSRYFLLVAGAPNSHPFTGAAIDRKNAAIGRRNGERIEITPVQWQFLRGVYAMNLEAPPGLPGGDTAVFAEDGDDPNGLLFFLDGEKPCAPVYAPRSLLTIMERVAATVRTTETLGPPATPTASC